MNKSIGLILLSITAWSCNQCQNQSTAEVSFNQPPLNITQSSDTVWLDLDQSNIKWKGTKMRGMGKHEGTVSISSGYLLVAENQLVGGSINVDMQSITVTDIPEHEPIPRNNLTKHLKSTDFFDIQTYPLSTLKILEVQPTTNNELDIYANLSLRGITKPIKFQAKRTQENYTANLMIDRFRWNVAYEGNLVDRTLVDKEIQLAIDIKSTKTLNE